jgi:hypothetical protein
VIVCLRSLPIRQVLIGPVAPRFARAGPLDPPAVAAFVESAPAGVAVVSFGSMPVFGNFLGREDFLGIAGALADLAPTRALWLLQVRPPLPAALPGGSAAAPAADCNAERG